MNEKIVYYSNSGNGSKITRDLITNFFQALEKELSSDRFLDFVSKSRVPNERELYGIFVKSIIESCDKEKIGHIATEFQVTRDDKDSKGRVDLLFNYRSVSYLLELKVGRVNAAKGEDKEPRKRTKEIWQSAVDQLNNLNNISVSNLLKAKVIKLPVTLFFYVSKNKALDNASVNREVIHKNILTFIGTDDFPAPDLYLYSSIPRTSTRLRTTALNTVGDTYLYGFSIFAKQI